MRILITAGPTREFLDSVRFLSNPSSGKMGYALAGEATRRGHDVALISGPVDLPEPERVTPTYVVSAAEMFEAATEAFAHCQAALMTAAVADYRPVERATKKLAKKDDAMTLELERTRDICAHLGHIKAQRVVVGFAMDDHDLHAHAQAKMERKRCDAIVLNGPGNIGGDRARIEILQVGGDWSPLLAGTKAQLAVAILDLVEELAKKGQNLP